LGLRHNIRIVGHDIGTMVAYSYAAAHPADVTKLVVSEAPLPDPSIYTYPALTAKGPGLWWFGLFNDPGNLGEKMFAGKEKQWVYGSMPILEVVKNSLTQCDLALWTHDLEKPGHLQATIDWFSTFSQDVKNDAIYQKTPLTMPVLAIGSAYVLGANVADQFRHYATHVTKLVIPDAGHWLYEEQPAEMTSDLLKFVG
jgi:pimeloyl-ACP methyl ester carboxylesterase